MIRREAADREEARDRLGNVSAEDLRTVRNYVAEKILEHHSKSTLRLFTARNKYLLKRNLVTLKKQRQIEEEYP